MLGYCDCLARVGARRVVLRFGFNAFAAYEAEGGSSFATIGALEAGQLQSAADLRRLCWAAMLHHQPEATLEDAGLVLDADPACVHRALGIALPPAGEAGGAAPAKKRIASISKRFWPRGSRSA